MTINPGDRIEWNGQFPGMVKSVKGHEAYVLFDSGPGTPVTAGHWIDIDELKNVSHIPTNRA